MPRLIPASERIIRARALIQKARDLPIPAGSLPSGQLISTSEDLAHYLIAQLNEGRYGDTTIVSPESMQTMHAPLVSMEQPGDFYGMGWENSTVNGLPAVWHGGENLSYSAALLMVPGEELGIVVLSNANGAFVALATVQTSSGILAILTDQQPEPYQRPGPFYVFTGSTGIPALISLLWVGWTVYRFLRRQKQSNAVRRDRRWWTWVIGVPLFVDLNLLFAALIFIPSQWGMPLGTMAKSYPDCFLMLFGGAVLVAVWSVLRTILSWRQTTRV